MNKTSTSFEQKTGGFLEHHISILIKTSELTHGEVFLTQLREFPECNRTTIFKKQSAQCDFTENGAIISETKIPQNHHSRQRHCQESNSSAVYLFSTYPALPGPYKRMLRSEQLSDSYLTCQLFMQHSDQLLFKLKKN